MNDNEIEKPNFWAVTPATIRYDARISEFSKLLYGEIWALSDKHGYCFSSNPYFARVYEVSERKVSRALAELVELGYIETIDNQGGESKRKLIPKIDPFVIVKNKNLDKNDEVNLDKSVVHNNTSNNNTSIDTKVSTETENVLPIAGKSSIQRLVNLYGLLWSKKYGTRPTVNFPRAGKALKSLVDSHGEYKTALVLIQYFSWRGATGQDEFLHNRLESNAFPLYWIPDHADPILAYIRNVVKLDVDSPIQVKKVVDGKIATTTTG